MPRPCPRRLGVLRDDDDAADAAAGPAPSWAPWPAAACGSGGGASGDAEGCEAGSATAEAAGRTRRNDRDSRSGQRRQGRPRTVTRPRPAPQLPPGAGRPRRRPPAAPRPPQAPPPRLRGRRGVLTRPPAGSMSSPTARRPCCFRKHCPVWGSELDGRLFCNFGACGTAPGVLFRHRNGHILTRKDTPLQSGVQNWESAICTVTRQSVPLRNPNKLRASPVRLWGAGKGRC
ncbi:CASP-like protein 4A2 [Panthera tigris]|uniref:CASP-like protein 4A2 n=1 Tax=Panthera tigris TaxID=9694 RepID=UPI001C6F9444|nr:CASP-like protein 4A2 [Panthera tigris]